MKEVKYKTIYCMTPKLSDRKLMGLPGAQSLGSGLIVKDSRELLRVMQLTVLDLVCRGGYRIVYNYVLYHLKKAEKRNPTKQKMPQ